MQNERGCIMAQIKYQNSEGYVWKKEWIRSHESLWGILQRYKLVNVMNDAQMMRSLGMANGQVVNFQPEECCYIKGNCKSRVKDFLGISSRHFAAMGMFQGMSADQASCFIEQNLKYCPVCLSRYGFHSYYHQLTGIEECPWHPEEKLITDKTRSYIIASGKSYAYGYKAFSKMDLLSPCLTEELPFPENLPDLPYNMACISAPQEYISKMKVPAFREISEFNLIARSGEDLKLKYSKMLETISGKLNRTAEEKELAKQYMPDNLDTETDFYNLILFLLVQKKLACYNKEEIQQGIAYVNGSNQKDANPDIVRLIQFAQNIFHCKDTQTIFQRKIFSQHTIAKKDYVLGAETIYAEYTFDFQISFYRMYRKAMNYIGACLLEKTFGLLLNKYDMLQSEKQIVSLKYPCFLVAEKSDGKIGFYLFEALENNGYESLDKS